MLSSRIYFNNILRNMLASVAGFIFCWMIFSAINTNTSEEIILAGFGILMVFAALFFYSAIVENILFFITKRRGLFSILLTHSTMIAIMCITYFYLEREFSLEMCCFLIVFISAQIMGFKYQNKVHLRKIKKGENCTA